MKAYTNIADVINDADVIIISTTADGHKNVIEKMKDFTKRSDYFIHSRILGCTEARQILGTDIEDKT